MARRTPITNIKVASAVGAVALAGLALGVEPAHGAGSWCTTSTLSWTGSAALGPDRVAFDTGLSVLPGAPGETVRIVDTTYVAYDEVAPDLDRSAPAETHERFGLTVGDAAVGELSADLPDDVASGAISAWSSGDHAGSLGGGPTSGGAVIIRHGAAGGTGPADRLTVTSLQITVERCARVAVTPIPAARLSAPVATPARPPATAGGDASVASGALPATGAATGPLVLAGLALVAAGAALVVVGGARQRIGAATGSGRAP